MSNWINNLRNWQRILIAAFFGNLGAALWILPFWMPGKEMVKPTGAETEWTNIHWLFLLFGTIAIAISLKLTRIDKLFNLAIGLLSKLKGNQKGAQK